MVYIMRLYAYVYEYILEGRMIKVVCSIIYALLQVVCRFVSLIRVSAAGYTKGVYTNALGLAYNPDEPQRNELYSLGINSVIEESGTGILLLGDKTLQGKINI